MAARSYCCTSWYTHNVFPRHPLCFRTTPVPLYPRLRGWAVSIIQQSGITPGVLAPHPFVSLESAGQLVSAGVCTWPVGRHLHVASWPPPARGQLAATCTWPVGRHLHVASWPPPARGQLAATCTWPVGRHLHVASWPPPARGQLAATCTWPVGRHLHMSNWPQVISEA